MEENNNINNNENIEEYSIEKTQEEYPLEDEITQEDEIQANEEKKQKEIEIDNAKAENLITVRPVQFQTFDNETVNRSIKKNLDILQDISMHISVEIGKTNSSIKEVMNLEVGSVVELDKIAGEQVEIYANNKFIARGEVIVMEDKFGVRVTTTNLPNQSTN